ncbi:DUF2515 family protein [Halobacillus faecis]|uniref:DUF2515 domain-containing protein n=1 Tax=Halobacillus faecis TaxID=360184 RepID=A0A511WPK6_9BACI|nr:DUF2515 family protein [Halobacillus faecis]GEN52178.1 hypothetical protein HFA01_04400 [Halobacillus faecis]
MFSSKWRMLKKDLKAALKSPPSPLTTEEEALVKEIRRITQEKNRNNVTRTMAYLHFFEKHPEVHWALLAHLVSRNAGWNMTDLKGEYLPKLLTGKEATDFFVFLERGNWLIFQDAYPQLLLYDASLKHCRPLYHLLDALNVSKFMKPFWERFWKNGNSEELTKALIVNEQHYIEDRVIRNHLYMATVMDKVMFKLQDVLSMNHILFPYVTPLQQKIKLVGGTVHHFSAVNERILLGRSLYELLYGVRSRLDQIVQWCSAHTHTGSRKDYWPQLFNDVNETPPGHVHEMTVSPCRRKQNGPKIYSPKLNIVWEDWVHSEAETGDWFKNASVLDIMKKNAKEYDGDIELVYCRTLEEIEFASQAKQTFFHKTEGQPEDRP